MSRRGSYPANLDEMRADISREFLRASSALYFIRPRSAFDPETGQARPMDNDEAGLIRFRMFPEQRATADIMLAQQRARRPVRVVKVKPRQSGDSTYGEVWNFHQTYWGKNQHALTVAHHEKTTTSLYDIAQTLYAELPDELKVGTEKLNRKELKFVRPYGNSLIAQTAGFVDIGHGLTINHVHLSEIDLYKDPDTVLEGIMETVAMTAGTSIYIESKAQGADGWLHDFWLASKKGVSGFHPQFTAWYQIPEYRQPVPTDFRPTEEEFAWIEQYHLSAAQVMWYRAKMAEMIAKEPWGGERRMRSSYPFTDIEAFQASGFCVFPDEVLARLREGLVNPKYGIRLDPLAERGEFHDTKVHPDTPGCIHIYREPEEGRFYCFGIDIGGGVGKADSVISVCAYPEYEQVAEWASDLSSAEHTAYVARWLAEYYGGGNVTINPEINKDGPFLLYLLMNMPGSFGLFRWRYLDKPGMAQTEHPNLGWQTTDATKTVLVQAANTVFHRGQGAIRSHDLHKQMTTCVDISPGRWQAQSAKSDRVIAWLLAVVAAFLEFDQGTIAGMVSVNTRERSAARGYRRQPWWHHCPALGQIAIETPAGEACKHCRATQPVSSWDDADEVFGVRGASSSVYLPGDTL